MVELKGKALAELRNKEIKEILFKLEEQRDRLYDEIANRQGKVELIEEWIKEIYGRIVSVNREIQTEELKEEVAQKAREEEAQRKEKDFAKKSRRIKVSKSKRSKKAKKSREE